MIRINTNQLKRAYAFVKENVVTFIVIVAIILGSISALAIFQEEQILEEEENLVFEEFTSQRIAMSNVKTLDPIKSQDRDTYYFDQLIYSSLFDYSNTFGLVTDLVSSYKTNEKMGSVTLQLKDNIYFHDGSKLVASDVVYTFNYIMRTGSSSLYFDQANKIYGIDAVGSNKLKVYFKNTYDASLDNLTFPIMKDGDGDFGHGFKPNGTGMYKVGKREKDKYIRLVPNKNYYGTVAENTIYCQVFPQSTDIENLINTYDVTAEFSKDFNGKSIADDKGLSHAFIPSNNMEYMAFNFNNPILAKKEMRKAIAYAVDLHDLVKYAYGDEGLVSDSIYFPGYYDTENKGDVYRPSFGNSLELIKKLKLADRDNDGYLEDENGETIELTIVVNDNASRLMVANTISERLEELQIKNHVEKLSWDDYTKALRNKEYDIFIGGYQLNKNDKLRFMFAAGNAAGYKNDKVNKLLTSMYSCNSIDTYKNTYIKLKEIISDELPYYCICYKQYSLLGTPKMEFTQLPTYEDQYRGINTWKYQKVVTQK